MQDLCSFLSSLSDDAQRFAPVTFHAVTAVDPAATPPVRLAESARHRTSRFECAPFHKPISRCFSHQPAGSPVRPAKAGGAAPAASGGQGPDSIFLLYACCVPVAGARRSSICDLQRGALQLIPNSLFEILKEHRGKTVGAIKELYDNQYDREIDEYFEFLTSRELGFWCDEEPENFPPLELSWHSPQRITNAIIDVDESSEHDFPALLRDLDDLGCEALQVRFFAGGDGAHLRQVLAAASSTCLRSIQLLVPYRAAETTASYRELCAEFLRVSHVWVHSAPADRVEELPAGHARIVYRREVLAAPHCCGQVHQGYFAIGLAAFSEAQRYNSCLHRKLAIDAHGEIKNCPSLPRSFGNVREVSLHGALANRDFTALWEVNKDQIEICRDCEFRYVCTDCRAYIDDDTNIYSKPAKCTYDPYTARWL